MQAGGVAVRDVYAVSGRVILNGVDIGADVEKISIDRDIPEGLPGASSFRSASGTVTATAGEDADFRVITPWAPKSYWPPKPMDQVEIVLSDGEREWTQFKGTVKDPAGSSDSRTVTFSMQDNYQSLNGLVTIRSLSGSMPSSTEGEHYRYVGLYTIFLADAALRQVGRYATPPLSSGSVVGATMQGSTWAERGVVRYSLKHTEDEVSGAYPNWVRTGYGMGVQNVDARYAPSISSNTPGGGRLTSHPLEITQEVVDLGPGSTGVSAWFPGGGRVWLAHSFSSVFARYYRPDGSTVDLASLSRTGLQRVSARFSLSAGTLSGSLQALNADGTISASETGTVPASYLTGVMEQVQASGIGSQGAFQVSFVSSDEAWSALSFQPNTVFHVAVSGWNQLRGFPTQVNVPAIEILENIAQAELAQWWIDEHDVLQWWDRGMLLPRASVATLTAADHLQEMPWKYDYDALRSKVVVRYKSTSIDASLLTGVTLWQGGSSTRQDNETFEDFIKVPSDEVWLGVSYSSPYRYGTSFAYSQPNKGIGSVVGGIAVGDGGDERRTNAISTTLRRISDDTYVAEIKTSNFFPGETASLKFPRDRETDPNLWSIWWGENLPILRGKKKITFVDETYQSTIQGPSQAPIYEHNAGFWIQDEAYAARVSDHAATALTNPAPVVDQASTMPVFNLQVGDVVVLSDPEVTGLEVSGVITSNSISADFRNGSADQKISLSPRSVRPIGARWVEFGDRRDGDTWSQFGADWDTSTWTDFGRNPLN